MGKGATSVLACKDDILNYGNIYNRALFKINLSIMQKI